MNELPNILLIEDNEDDYEATLRSFKKNLFLNPIHWCKNGEDALNYLHKKQDYANNTAIKTPDLIMLDLNMPGIDGKQVLKTIKETDKLKKIPVIILSTSIDTKDIEQCYELGASTYIQKPVSFEGLTQAIRTMKDYWFGVAILPRNSE